MTQVHLPLLFISQFHFFSSHIKDSCYVVQCTPVYRKLRVEKLVNTINKWKALVVPFSLSQIDIFPVVGKCFSCFGRCFYPKQQLTTSAHLLCTFNTLCSLTLEIKGVRFTCTLFQYTHPFKPHSHPGHGTNLTPSDLLASHALSGIRTSISHMGRGHTNKDAKDRSL